MQKITADLSEIPCSFGDKPHAGRVETGALQINDDWPGIFIRGDNALYDAMQCHQAAAILEKYIAADSDKNVFSNTMVLSFLKNHAKLLGSSRI